MYEAERWDQRDRRGGPNELYPMTASAGLEATCLELYSEFRNDPERFFVTGPAA